MPQADFYVLARGDMRDAQLFTCRLVEKAYKQSLSVHICVDDEAAVAQLDEALWTFRDGSFLPHELASASASASASADDCPITLGTPRDLGCQAQLLVNIAADLPGDFASYPRIAEIVCPEPGPKRRSREHFKKFRDQGFTLSTHNIGR